MSKINEISTRKDAVRRAEEWNNLPNGPKYMNADFKIVHNTDSCLKLVRAGQQSCGGKNYWTSPAELNCAIRDIIASDNTIITRAIDLLKEKHRLAIIDAKGFAEDLLKQVKEAEAV